MKKLAVSAALALGALGAFSVTSGAVAQNLEEIRERARFLEEYKAMISPDADKSLRMAAIEEGLKSKDDLIRREAFDATLDSKDADLIYLGLRYVFKQRTQFLVELTLPDEPNAEQQKSYDRYHQLTVNRLELMENGEISFNNNYKGAFITKGFVLNWSNCNLKITSVAKEMLSGSFTCDAGSTLPARILID